MMEGYIGGYTIYYRYIDSDKLGGYVVYRQAASPLVVGSVGPPERMVV